jgi:hypothetical protein
MIEIIGNDIYRAGMKIGWLSEDRIYNHMGKLMGYFTTDTIYDVNGNRLAYIQGNYVDVGGKQIDLEQILCNVVGAGLSNAARVAIAIFLGE